ncbi:MAG: tetratricopeptide repeat protein [Anaerolineae bacterium]
MDRQWLLRFLTLSQYPEKDGLLAELCPGEAEPRGAAHHNLPGRPYESFIGREKELADLVPILAREHRIGVVCISGIGGVGKTALAQEVAHRFCTATSKLPSADRFEAIVWVTAKRTELLARGLTQRQPTFSDLDGVYRAIADVLDLPAVMRAATREEQELLVTRVLGEHRVLLVLDNLEDVDDPALMVFLRDLPTPSKAVVTTRHRIDVAAPIHLRALNESDAQKLIASECQRHNLQLTNDECDKLLRRTGGLPLAIVRTIGRMAWRGSSIEMELRQLGAPTSEIYQFCFDKSIALIQGSDAHRLFMALALFAADASRTAIGEVAGLNGDTLSRDEGLSDLDVLSLVNKSADRFSLDPLTKVRAQAELRANPAFEESARERFQDFYTQFAFDTCGETYWGSYLRQERYDEVEREFENILAVFSYAREAEDNLTIVRLFSSIVHFMARRNRWPERLSWVHPAIAAAQRLEDVASEVWFRIDALGWMLLQQGRTEEALEQLNLVEKLVPRLDVETAYDATIFVHCYRSRAARRRGDLDEAYRALQPVFDQPCHPFASRHLLTYLGELLYYRGEYAQARKVLAEAAAICDEIGDDSGRAIVLNTLGLTLVQQTAYAEAEPVLDEVLAFETSLGRVHGIARAQQGLAMLAWARGDRAKALELGRRSSAGFARLGMRQEEAEVANLIADWGNEIH